MAIDREGRVRKGDSMATREPAQNQFLPASEAPSNKTSGWSVDLFAAFWSEPSASLERIPSLVARDIVGYWPGGARPARGAHDYWQYIVELLRLVPDFRVRVMEYAASGEVHFLLWEASGTGSDGSFTATGCDCMRVREGILHENRVFCEHPVFKALAARIASINS
jgi:hypothetical protein